MSSNVRVYTIESCPYCSTLKNKLEGKGIPFTEVDVDENEEEFSKVRKITESDMLPTVIVGKNVLVPEVSFNKIDEAVDLVEQFDKGDSEEN